MCNFGPQIRTSVALTTNQITLKQHGFKQRHKNGNHFLLRIKQNQQQPINKQNHKISTLYFLPLIKIKLNYIMSFLISLLFTQFER